MIIGNSMGAGAATWAAAENPEAVSGLVLVGPFVRNAPVGALSLILFRLALMKPWGRWAWNAYIPKLYPGRAPHDLDEHRRRIRESLDLPGHWDAFAETSHTSHAPAEARLGEIRVPTLVVMGDADPDFPDPVAEADWITNRLHASSLIVPGAGHYPHAEYPETVNPRLVAFLDETVRHA